MRKAPKGGELDELDAQINQIIAKVRSKVEHPFPILKRQFGHVKNRAHLFTLFALGNLLTMRRRLAA
jgi:IS5 family transposase